jgi:hypothetical protein
MTSVLQDIISFPLLFTLIRTKIPVLAPEEVPLPRDGFAPDCVAHHAVSEVAIFTPSRGHSGESGAVPRLSRRPAPILWPETQAHYGHILQKSATVSAGQFGRHKLYSRVRNGNERDSRPARSLV